MNEMAQDLLKDIVAVRHLGGHRLWLRFDDGVEGDVDLRKVIGEFRGVLAPLLNPSFVAQVHVHPEFGTITWPGELDLDPVVLYCAVRGIPVPSDESRPEGGSKAAARGGRGKQPGVRKTRRARKATT